MPRLAVKSRFAIRRQPRVYGTMGSLEVRLARTGSDVRRAQRLRFQVFYNEMSAVPDRSARMQRRDIDSYDSVCDHLLVLDHGSVHRRLFPSPFRKTRRPRVVGTYRMLRQDVAEQFSGFYTQKEFDLAPLIAARGAGCRIMELGRSCVLQPYRNRRTIELLWHGLWTYVREHKISVMVGCASFEGTTPEAHAQALSFLHHNVLAPEEWRVSAHNHLRVDMDRIPAHKIKPREVLKALPPLIKGYLRLGCFVGDGAVVDPQFGTTDVLMILPVEKIDPRYFAHFGAPDEHQVQPGGNIPG
ncbi:MAG: GNAT family N-acetyltransferase [Hyphomicrobiaceae bacterium]